MKSVIARETAWGWQEHALRVLTGLRPYRCLGCGRRFYDWATSGVFRRRATAAYVSPWEIGCRIRGAAVS
ncbi:MAG: hypothetical protein HYU41_19100 [Candidatus Rokubacteria bacterium]|nr:hypothetical protein [Candidatus Rokubacteria bacterium]